MGGFPDDKKRETVLPGSSWPPDSKMGSKQILAASRSAKINSKNGQTGLPRDYASVAE
jgi:hypothetical protein